MQSLLSLSQAFPSQCYGISQKMFFFSFIKIPNWFLSFHNLSQSALAGHFVWLLLPSLWPYLIYRIVERYLQNQGKTFLTLIVAALMALLNILLNYLFIYTFVWGFAGSPLATSVSVRNVFS